MLYNFEIRGIFLFFGIEREDILIGFGNVDRSFLRIGVIF